MGGVILNNLLVTSSLETIRQREGGRLRIDFGGNPLCKKRKKEKKSADSSIL